MKTKLLILKSLLLLFLITSCSKEDENITQDFVVAFEKASISFDASDTKKNIKLVFSRPATENGTVVVKCNATNAVYGVDKDFTTIPQADASGLITLEIKSGDNEATFEFSKLKNPVEGSEKSVDFSITKVNFPLSKIQGNKSLAVSFTETASLAGSFAPEIGGPNEPNQVYVDLSSETQKSVKRDTWDLAFYSGDNFRVKLNGAIFMGAAKLDITDLNAVKESDVTDLKSKIATGIAGSGGYFDDPSGDITKTVISEISANDAENKVYLLKLGFKVSSETPNVGSVKLSGDSRGWKKIRILRSDNGYKLLYANIEDTTYKEVTISKTANYNFTFFSFDTKKTLQIEPEKKKWDISFAPFTNVIPFGPSVTGAYGFSDFVIHNVNGGALAYMVEDKTEKAYENFKLSDVDSGKLSNNQTTIGSKWRSVFKKNVKANRFFILKDADNNVYKIKFTALVSDTGVRGHSKFEYALLK